jgi:uncharacterized membrane protein YeaQ/YmgE (transglycosylase-associated protein family)
MPEWMIWSIVAGIGLAAAVLIHAIMRQSQGTALFGTLLFGIAGALLAAWIIPRYVNAPGMSLTEERFIWAAAGGLVLSLIYELATVGSHRSRILIPSPGR